MNEAKTIDTEFTDLIPNQEQYEDDIVWPEVKARIVLAINETGTDINDVARLVGLDIGAPDYIEKYQKLPKMKTAIAVATYLGVPALWVLTGRGKKPILNNRDNVVSANGFRDTSDSTVVQGNNAGTLIVQNGAVQMSEQKKELMRIFDRLSIRDQTKLLHIAYEIDEGRQGSA